MLFLPRPWTTLKPPPGVAFRTGHPLTHQLRACWLFNENGGLKVADAVRWPGQPEDGTIANTSDTAWTVGPFGPALRQTTGVGSNGITFAAGGPVNFSATDPFTIELRAMLVGTLEGFSLLVSSNGGSGLYAITGGAVRLYPGGASSATPFATAGRTVHLVAIHKAGGGAGSVQFWIDGVFDAPSGADSGAVNFTNMFNDSGSETFQGRIDYVRIWGRELTPTEIVDLYVHPFAMFRPRGLVWPKAAAAGGTTYTHALTSALATAGALTRRSSTLKAGTLNAAGALTRQPQKPVAGTLSSVGAIVKRTSKLPAGTVPSSGALTKIVGRALAGTLTSAGAVAAVKTALKALTGAMGLSGALTKQTSHAVAGTLASAGALVKRTARALTGSLASAGALAGQKLGTLFTQSVSGVMASAGALLKRTNKLPTGAMTASGALTRQIMRALDGSIAPSGGLTRRIARALSGALSWVGSLLGINLGGTVDGVVVVSVAAETRIVQVPTDDRVLRVTGDDRRVEVH